MTSPGSAWRRLHADTRGTVFGFLDQSFSTATNFGLTLLAGRALGPGGLGEAFVGFSVYLAALGLQRRLVTDPLVAATTGAGQRERKITAGHAVTFSCVASVVVTLGVLLVGLLLPGFVGRGMLLFTPWLVAALVQDVLRSILFRDGRGSSATVNDAVWLGVMLVAAVPAWFVGEAWAIVGCWGIGAVAAMALGLVQVGARPRDLKGSWWWWRRRALGFGKWNAGAAFMSNLSGTAITFILAAGLGPAAVGGLRAAQSIFAPLTLVIPAISMPGLPAVTRALKVGYPQARRKGLSLSGLALVVVGAYVVAMALGAWRLLPILFGDEFAAYLPLLPPIGTAQVITASGIGLLLILKASQRGRVLFVNRVVGAVASVTLVSLFAWRDGLRGAAWGLAFGAAASLAVLAWSALRPPGPSVESPTPTDGAIASVGSQA